MASVLLTVHILVCISLVALILLQRTDADGMGSLGGGGGGNMNSFLTGRAAANLLTRTTAILATVFFITSLSLTLLGRSNTGKSILDAAPAAVEEKAVEPKAADKPKDENQKPSVPLAQ